MARMATTSGLSWSGLNHHAILPWSYFFGSVDISGPCHALSAISLLLRRSEEMMAFVRQMAIAFISASATRPCIANSMGCGELLMRPCAAEQADVQKM